MRGGGRECGAVVTSEGRWSRVREGRWSRVRGGGCNFIHLTLPVSFGRDTKSRWSLLSGVYARGSQ